MYNKFMKEAELNVKVGDIVAVQGNRGTVTEVIKVSDVWTGVRVHFEGELASWGQYQNGVYGAFTVIEKGARV